MLAKSEISMLISAHLVTGRRGRLSHSISAWECCDAIGGTLGPRYNRPENFGRDPARCATDRGRPRQEGREHCINHRAEETAAGEYGCPSGARWQASDCCPTRSEP